MFTEIIEKCIQTPETLHFYIEESIKTIKITFQKEEYEIDTKKLFKLLKMAGVIKKK